MSWDKKVYLFRCPFVPGQEQQQKSQDKLLCPGHTGTKTLYDWQKNLKNSNFLLLFSSCPVAVPGNSRTGQAAKIPYL